MDLNDPDTALESFVAMYREIFDECTTVSMKSIDPRVPVCHWMNSHLRSVLNSKDNYFRKHKNSLNSPTVKAKLAMLEADVEKLRWFYKNVYHKEMFRNSFHDRKKTWRNINRLLGRDREGRKEGIKKITIGGVDYVSDREKAMALNDYFTKVAKKITDTCGYVED